MNSGKVLKVRIGHEANCSSGMVPIFMLILGGGAGLMLALSTAIAQAIGHQKRAPADRLRKLYLIIPLALGLVIFAGLGVWLYPDSYSTADEASIAVLGLGMAASYSLALAAGYRLAPRIRYWICLVTPLIFALGTAISVAIAIAWIVLFIES